LIRPLLRAAGLSLVEILVAMGILAILGVIAFAGYRQYIPRAELTACLGNLRSLHAGFSAYIQDKLHWPQQPEDEASGKVLLEDWWISELKPYGIPEKTWTCPAIRRTGASLSGDMPKIHYMPADFDVRPFAPFEFSKQPWFIEIASPHPEGANICFPDGSIHSMDSLLNKKRN